MQKIEWEKSKHLTEKGLLLSWRCREDGETDGNCSYSHHRQLCPYAIFCDAIPNLFLHMNSTLTFVKLAVWAWTIAIYCCLAERIAVAFWMACSPAQAVKALLCLLSLENGLRFEHLWFLLMPAIIWLMHLKCFASSSSTAGHIAARFQKSKSLCAALGFVQILLASIAVASIPTIAGAGGQALAFAAGDSGCYEIGERMFRLSMNTNADRLGRSLLWYRGQMDDGYHLNRHDTTVVATVYGTRSRQLKAVSFTLPQSN